MTATPAAKTNALLAALLCASLGTLRARAASVMVCWEADPATNVTGYAVHWGPVSRGAATDPSQFRYANSTNVPPGPSPFATVRGLPDGQTLFFAVTARDENGEQGPYSDELSYPYATPTPPADLAAYAPSSSRIDLSWMDNSSNETGFVIDRRQGGTDAWIEIARLGADTSTYADSGLPASTTFYYRITACNAAGASAWPPIAGANTGEDLPAQPGNVAATALSSTHIRVTWQDNSNNETQFKIRRSLDGIDWGVPAPVFLAANTSSYTDSGLTPGTTYYYKMRAENEAGVSPYTAPVSAQTLSGSAPQPPAAPSGFTGAALSHTQIRLSWTDNSDNETEFKIRRSMDGTDWETMTPIFLPANTTSYTESGLTPDTTYYYMLRSQNDAGTLGYQAPIRVTTTGTTPSVPGLVARWAFDEGSGATADDSSGHGYDGTLVGGPKWTSGKYGAALDFDGVDDCVNVPGHALHFATGNSPRTICGWFEADAAHTEYKRQFFGYGSWEHGYGKAFTCLAATKYIAIAFNGTRTEKTGVGVGAGWHHVAFVVPDGAQKTDQVLFYLDGNLLTGYTATGNGAQTLNTYVDPNQANAEIAWFNEGKRDGKLDDIRIYNRALSAAEIQTVINDGGSTPPPQPPAQPRGVTATALSSTQIQVTWQDNSDDETQFKIRRSLDGVDWYVLDPVLLAANTTSYTDSGLTPSTTRYYIMRAENDAGVSAYTDPPVSATTPSDAAIPNGAVWRYRKGTAEASEPAGAWRRPGFDDSAWPAGSAPLGYGQAGLATTFADMQNSYSCLFLRTAFNVAHASRVTDTRLNARFDDGFILWINGQEIARVNVPGEPGDPVALDSFTLSNLNSSVNLAWSGAQLPELRDGANVAAVQVFNRALESGDLFFDAELTLSEDALPEAEDADGDGLPDDWETAQLAGLSDPADRSASADPDGDGLSNLEEFIAGTDPASGASVFAVDLALAVPHGLIVSFAARAAAGTGYEGYQRHYVLEQRDAIGTDAIWLPVPGYEDVLGAGQTAACTNAAPGHSMAYRARVWLTPVP